MKDTYILAIESSCDETSMSIIKNGSEEIKRLIEKEDFDAAMSMIKQRESIFLNCKCMRKYLELTPVQEKQLNDLLDILRDSELENIRILNKGLNNVKLELKKTQQREKIQQAYDLTENQSGSIINYNE